MEHIDIKQAGVEALHEACKTLGIPYQIKVSFKRHNFPITTCTVLVNGKSFTARGERGEIDGIIKAIREAVYYMVETFSVFSNIKEELDKKRAEGVKLCEPETVGEVVPVKALLEE